jgi:hypothetical protein
MTNAVGPAFKHRVPGWFLGDMLVLVSSVLNEHFAKRVDWSRKMPGCLGTEVAAIPGGGDSRDRARTASASWDPIPTLDRDSSTRPESMTQCVARALLSGSVGSRSCEMEVFEGLTKAHLRCSRIRILSSASSSTGPRVPEHLRQSKAKPMSLNQGTEVCRRFSRCTDDRRRDCLEAESSGG